MADHISQISKIIRKQIGLPKFHILSESDRLDEIGVDSLSYVALVVRLEDEFEIEFPDELLVPPPDFCIGGLYDAVLMLLDAKKRIKYADTADDIPKLNERNNYEN